MGDTFKNISNSTIFNRSTVDGAITLLGAQGNTGSADALRSLAEYVQKSGNAEAGEYLETLSGELERQEPRKSILRSMWDGIQNVLPAVSSVVGIAGGIAKLIG